MNKDQDNRPRVSRLRRIVGDALIILVVALAVDIVAVMLYRIGAVAEVLRADYRKILWFELGVCAAMLLCALDVRFGLVARLRSKVARVAANLVRILAIAFVAMVLFFCGRSLSGCFICTAESVENVIVLGMALENDAPSNDLILRLDTAKEFLDQGSATTLILTGGNADSSGKTEAETMREYLVAQGVPESSLVLEDEAKSTKDNFDKVARLIDSTQPVVLVTSNYHMDRATNTASATGFQNVLRLPAPSDPLSFCASVMQEASLDINECVSTVTKPTVGNVTLHYPQWVL